MREFGGLWRVIPVFTLFFLIVTLSSIGLPGLNGFIGEFLILLGAFAQPAQRVVTAIGATGVILGACYMLWMFQKVAEGPLDNPENRSLRDLTPREIAVLAPLVALIFVIGVFPNILLRQFDQSVHAIVTRVESARGPAVGSRRLKPQMNADGRRWINGSRTQPVSLERKSYRDEIAARE